MVGSLLVAMLVQSFRATGLALSYIELRNGSSHLPEPPNFCSVAVSMVEESDTKIICALFHDVEDGPEFGRGSTGSMGYTMIIS